MNRGPLPRSLVQIHYHDGLGGVNQVIGHYAALFRRFGDGANLVVAAHRESPQHLSGPAATMLAVCDYHRYRSAARLKDDRNAIAEGLRRILLSADTPAPVAIVGHNLTLGKNPAVSAAFTTVARALGSDRGRFRFFSVIHDFAEHGRVRMIETLRGMPRMGLHVGRDIYALGAPVHFVVPNLYSKKLLGHAGFPVSWLPNPVRPVPADLPLSRHALSTVVRNLGRMAHDHGASFDPSLPVCCYPSRIIPRKNMLEAVLICSALCRSNLLLGPSESTREGIARAEAIGSAARRLHLNVVVDAPRAVAGTLKAGGCAANPAVALYLASDFGMSTSIAEGFGYALYEPWLYGKPLFGRRPPGFAYPRGIDQSLLYDWLPVPADWIDMRRTKRACERAWRRCYGNENGVPRPATGSTGLLAVRDGFVDFGVLDEAMQMQVLEIVGGSRTECRSWAESIREARAGWPGVPDFRHDYSLMVAQNRARIDAELGEAAFERRFRACLRIIPARVPERTDWRLPGLTFMGPEFFRLLLTAT